MFVFGESTTIPGFTNVLQSVGWIYFKHFYIVVKSFLALENFQDKCAKKFPFFDSSKTNPEKIVSVSVIPK